MLEALKGLSTFIMAGGKGERLFPLTKDRAKPAVPFGGTYRIIDFTLSNCINSGIRRIHVLTQYKSVSLDRHLGMGWNIFHSELGEHIDMIPAQQRVGEYWYRGTADAIFQNVYTIERENPDYVLILAGDHIYKMDYSKMLLFHLERGAEVSVGVVNLPINQGKQLGVLEVDQEDRIVGFEEKPSNPKSLANQPDMICASMGIYIFNTKTLYDELIFNAKEDEHDFGKDIIPRMLEKRKVYAYHFVDENQTAQPYWRDIGTMDAYYEANMDFISVSPQFNLYDKHWPIRTYQLQLPPVKMVFADEGKRARRGQALDSLVSSGCVISGGTVKRSVLSPQVRINSYASIEDSVLMYSVDIGRHARVRKTIIDKYVTILPKTEIGYDLEKDRKRFHVTDSGVVVIPKGRIIGPNEDRPRWEDHSQT